ncbi:hypothetical protein P7K49_000324 [Saguinus oedipus]|uniref:Uncharacterized protein n=1 Tax=Saguinus oedipus TaxID=9490 RepID=A0ABQ9WBD1_SAGOE|nr:hypothetical protein P7K49_000324 [Saguinus oedipus]
MSASSMHCDLHLRARGQQPHQGVTPARRRHEPRCCGFRQRRVLALIRSRWLLGGSAGKGVKGAAPPDPSPSLAVSPQPRGLQVTGKRPAAARPEEPTAGRRPHNRAQTLQWP